MILYDGRRYRNVEGELDNLERERFRRAFCDPPLA